MNARQKAKKYKRMYEALLKKPVEIKVEQHKIDTLRFERFYTYLESPILKNSDYLRNVIANDISRCLVNDHGKYIDFHIEFCPHINRYRLYGEIKVINKEDIKNA